MSAGLYLEYLNVILNDFILDAPLTEEYYPVFSFKIAGHTFTSHFTNVIPQPSDDFSKIKIPLIRRAYPNLIAAKIVAVQPLSIPSSLKYYLNHKYTKTKTTSSSRPQRLPPILQIHKYLGIWQDSDSVKHFVLADPDCTTKAIEHITSMLDAISN